MAESTWKAVDLRRLLFAVVGGILVIIIFAFAVLAWTSAERLVEPTVERQLAERSGSAVSVIEAEIENALLESRLLSLAPALIDASVEGAAVARRRGVAALPIDELEERFAESRSLLVAAEADRYLRAVVNESRFAELFATDKNGFVVAGSGLTSDFVQRDEEWWTEAFAGRDGVSDVGFDESVGAMALSMTSTMRDSNDNAVGVLKAVLPLNHVQRTLADLARGWGYVQLLDERGRLISDPHPEHLLEKHPDRRVLVQDRLVRSTDPEGRAIVGMVQPALGGRWTVVYWVSEEQGFAMLHTARRAVGLFVAVAFLTALVGILIAGSWVSREIGRPVKMVADAADRVGGGDLRVSVRKVGKGEVGRLCATVQEMIDRLRELVGSIREASFHTQARSQEIAGAVEQLSSGSQEMSATLSRLTAEAAQHADTIGEMDARMEVLGAAARDLAMGAETSTERSRQLRDEAEKGRLRLRDGHAQMGQMAERSDVATSRLLEFMNASRQFGDFVDLIKQFARRTNLLALNAAIEAARSGGDARGFAVLADEIRKLANQAGDAASRAQETTDAVLGQIETAHVAIEETRETTQTIGAVVESLDESFDKVTRAMGEAEGWADRVAQVSADVDGSVRKMAEMLNTVSSGFTDFAAAMEELAAGMEEQNASTEEIAAAVNALNTSAWELSGLAEVFILDELSKANVEDRSGKEARNKAPEPRIVQAASLA